MFVPATTALAPPPRAFLPLGQFACAGFATPFPRVTPGDTWYSQPLIPLGPWGPAAPGAPCPPISPFGPVGPAWPFGPPGPCSPRSPFGPCGPAGPDCPLRDPSAVGLRSFVPSERFLTSRPVTVPSLMFLPVMVVAAYALPPSATNSAR